MRDSLASLDDLMVAIARLHRSPAMRRALVREVPGLTSAANLRVLRAVQLREGLAEAPTIGDVAHDLDIEHSTASREVSAVVEGGYLVKVSSSSDMRKTCLSLTDHGRSALNEATATRLRWLEESLHGWSEHDLHTLVTLLDRLVNDYTIPAERQHD